MTDKKEDDQLLEVEEGGTAGGDASVEGDRNPRVELQEPGSATLPRKRTPDHSPCHYHHYPSLWRLLGRSVCRWSMQECR